MSNSSVDKKNASFLRSLCFGEIEESLLFPFPKLKQTEKENLVTVVDTIDQWLKNYTDQFQKWDEAGDLPLEFLQEMKEMGMFSLIIPEEYGGMGFGATSYSRVLQAIARFDGSVAITAGAHSSIGMRGLLLFGTKEQKEKYLPLLSRGKMIAAFCLTEPGAGSDAAALRTKAVKDGKDWIISGEKLWITNGGIADFFTVFAKTDGDQGNMSAFIITKDMQGVSCGPHENKMGLRASSTTTVLFDKVRVSESHLLGEEGKGFKVAMKILNSGRTGLGGGTIGSMKKCIELSTLQAKQRMQFGKTISEFGLIKQKIGHMMVECYATEAMVNTVAGWVDDGFEDYAVEAAISKVFATECLWRTVDEALQIAGGNGYMREYPYERILRDSRINRIFEGTNEILRLFIALTAMNDVGKELKELSTSLEGIFNDPIKGFGLMSDYARRKASHLTGMKGTKSNFTQLSPELSKYGNVFEENTRDLAIAVDKILRKHGKKIIEKQFATKRLADIMIDLFAHACVLSRVDQSLKEKGSEKAKKEIEILEIFTGQTQRRIKGNFRKIDQNDDELIKSLADHALEQEKYPWDIF